MRTDLRLRTGKALVALVCIALLPCSASAQVPIQRFDCTLLGVRYRLTEDLEQSSSDGIWQCDATDGVAPWRLPQQIQPPRAWRHAQGSSREPNNSSRGTESTQDRITPQLHALLEQAAQQAGLPSSLLRAIVKAESGYRVRAQSERGALGLMQLMPQTARAYGVFSDEALLNPHINLQVGARHLRELLTRYPGRLDLALAAYNAGPEAVRRAGQAVPNIPETRRYVQGILRDLGLD